MLAAQGEQEKGSKKIDKKKELDQLNELFKPVVAAQKVSKGNCGLSLLMCRSIRLLVLFFWTFLFCYSYIP